MGALVSRHEGARQRQVAGRYCASSLWFNGLLALAVSGLAWFHLRDLLHLLGARGVTLDYAVSYAQIVMPNMPVLVLGMSAAAAARALGDARRSLNATLAGSAVNAVLDPLFIFTFGWGLEGAALASVAARFTILVVAWHAIFLVHRLPVRITFAEFRADLGPILQIAAPAMLTNLATPIGSSFVLKTMAQFGDSAVAGAAILGRITPVAFAAVFSLSGAVGPIIGQNAGAGRYDRVRATLYNALLFNLLYVLVVWVALWSLADLIVQVFSASDLAAELIRFYTLALVWAFIFNGMLFVANAGFNNLHRPQWATAFNFGKALLGTVPCVYFGARWYGAPGVLAGEAVGAVLFGVLAMLTIFRLVRDLERRHVVLAVPAADHATAVSSFSSAHSQMGLDYSQAAAEALEKGGPRRPPH
jgi:putative MATE family efflux protein